MGKFLADEREQLVAVRPTGRTPYGWEPQKRKYKNKKNKSFDLRCFLVVPRGFEPLIPPWKGGVLTTWPWDHIPLLGADCWQKSAICLTEFVVCHKKIRKDCVAWVLLNWWRWVELNYRSIGYEPIALTAEPHRREHTQIINENLSYVKRFFKLFQKKGFWRFLAIFKNLCWCQFINN